jgi:hypothetical protein
MWFLIVAILITLAYFLFRNKTEQGLDSKANLNNGKSDIPSKVYNPANYNSFKNIIAWEFLAPNLSTACTHARNNAGIRKKSQDCAPLPLSDCNSESCLCHYRAIYDSRHQQRREQIERRESFRFSDNTDRRSVDDRRKDQTDWHDKHLK